MQVKLNEQQDTGNILFKNLFINRTRLQRCVKVEFYNASVQW